jgi:HPt (histidine-containing phosphotransfer) domain-containing protein
METLVSPSRAGAARFEATERAIDLVHLARMTCGDRTLEREVLDMFVRQAGTIVAAMSGATPASLAALAHRLKGSARGIGAWRVATAAESVEGASKDSPESAARAVAALAARVEEAKSVVEDLLRSH